MNGQELKNSILQLAIQGRLVEHSKEEGTAKELLKQIKAEKEKLIKEGKIKKSTKLSEITKAEIPFDIPESWNWTRLEDVAYLKSGGQYNETQDGYLYIKVADMNLEENKTQITTSTRRVVCSENNVIPKGSIIFPKRGGAILTNKKRLVLKEEICIDSNTMSLTVFNDVCLPYIYTWFSSKDLGQLATGTSVPQINNKDIYPLLVPLPPLEEQKRIVAKIEELMPYVEKYDKAYSEVEKLNKKFPEDIQKSILRYAIQGKLVEQREEEGTAKELYQQIQEEKEKLIKKGKIKKQKLLAEITEDEIPFDIPESWKWVRLGNLFNVSTGMTPSKSNPLFHENGDIPWITSSQTGDLKIEKANNFITKFAVENTNLKIYPKHTMLIAMYGQGKTRGQISELLIDATINQACAALENIINNNIFRNYILYFQIYNYDISRTGSEGSAQPNLNLDKIRNIIVPLPPLEEQKRIVAKIEELLPYTKQLVKE